MQARVPQPTGAGAGLEVGATAAVLPVRAPTAMSHLPLNLLQGLSTSRHLLPLRHPKRLQVVRLLRQLSVRRLATAGQLRLLLRQLPMPGRVKTPLQGSSVKETATVLGAGEVVEAAEAVRVVRGVRAVVRTPSPPRVDRTLRVVLRNSASHNRADETVPPSPNGPSKPFSAVTARNSTRKRLSGGRAGSATADRSVATS